MPHGGDPTLPPPAKSPKLSGQTTIDSLDEDVLLDIFLFLPSLASLIRAALTCRAWRRAVASSPAFRRRFRELHRAPLLGLFAEPQRDALPSFAPAPSRDRDVLAAIRGVDFALTSLQDPDGYACDAPLRWRVHDCRGGYLLLMNWDAALLATVNPLDRDLTDYFDMPFDRDTTTETEVTHRGKPISVDVHLLCSDEEPMSFRLVWLFHDESRVQVGVFSSETCDWFFHPWVHIKERAPPHDADKYWLHSGVQVNGHLYWLFRNQEHMLKLDIATMEFSVLEMPPNLKTQDGYSYIVGETKDGTPCIVYSFGLNIGVLIHGVDDNGVDGWIFGGMVQYEGEAEPPENGGNVHVVAIMDGFVYLATSEMVLSLCLETMELEKLFPRSFRAHCFRPYIMAWPPSLVGDYGIFAVIHDGSSDGVTREIVLSLCLETMELEKLFPSGFSGLCFRLYNMAWPPLVGNYGTFCSDPAWFQRWRN
ncbi:hypothetical protein ACP70R_037806 [Stipagrostis hirtigluma subsp. patula]